jgi:hypothetical protein
MFSDFTYTVVKPVPNAPDEWCGVLVRSPLYTNQPEPKPGWLIELVDQTVTQIRPNELFNRMMAARASSGAFGEVPDPQDLLYTCKCKTRINSALATEIIVNRPVKYRYIRYFTYEQANQIECKEIEFV